MDTLKVYVGVKYAEKEEAKKKGCKWDKEKKGWYLSIPIDEHVEKNVYEKVFNGGFDLKGYKPYKYQY